MRIKLIILLGILVGLCAGTAAAQTNYWESLILGYNPKDVRYVLKFGQNLDVDAAEDMAVTGGDLSLVTWGSTITVSADSTKDDTTGVGARTLVVQGLDTLWAEQSETITLNGGGDAVGTVVWSRVHRAYVATAGDTTATNSNTGALLVKSTTGAQTVITIPIGYGQSQKAQYTVPDGYEAALVAYSCDLADQQASNRATCAVMTRGQGEGWRIRDLVNVSVAGTSVALVHPPLPIATIPSKTDIKIRALSVASANTDMSGHFALIVYRK